MCTLSTLYNMVREGQPGVVDITMHDTRFNSQDPIFESQIVDRSCGNSPHRRYEPNASHLPDAAHPSACLTLRRLARCFHLAIRSTNCALTETCRDISPIAPTHFSPMGTVCFYVCSYVLTDMLTTAHVSSHTPAQDTAAHCIPTTVAHKIRLLAESGQDAPWLSLLVCTELTALLATSVSWRYANLSSLACVSQQRPLGG
jgi:hypothetical protein